MSLEIENCTRSTGDGQGSRLISVLNSRAPEKSERIALLSSQRSHIAVDSALPRPCYHLLRITGVWQPKECHVLWKLYAMLMDVFFVGAVVFILLLNQVHNGWNKFVPFEFVNSIFTAMNLGCPFVFIKYCFCQPAFDALVSELCSCSPLLRARVVRMSRVCTALSAVLWLLAAAFFIVHWLPFCKVPWHYGVYIVTVVLTTAWWACWLSVYGFVCQLHSLDAVRLIDHMRTRYAESSGSARDEKIAAADVLNGYNQFNESLHSTQDIIGKVISISVVYHAIDIVVFSFAYWKGDFGKDYVLWQFVAGISFDFISIFMKLYPAAIVSAAVRRLAIWSGRLCQSVWDPEHQCFAAPVERFTLFRHVISTEPYVGLKILTVKVTMRLTVGLMVTVVTVTASLLRFVVPTVY